MSAEHRIRIGVRPPHDVVLGHGLLARLGDLTAEVLAPVPVLVATDAGVAGTPHVEIARSSLHAAGFATHLEVLPRGEAAKTVAGAEQLWNALADAGIGRDGGVVAVGGGAVGDVAGFAAATWMRGVACVQVPTTVLAMADSSVGGKTAIDRREGKNLVGAFHQPRLVVSDVATLATLEVRELRAGLAEVVKCALLAGRAALDDLASVAGQLADGESAAMVDAILMAVSVKERHVRDDQRETDGERVFLNLGHTTAHALERADAYAGLRHGEAVAVGLVVAARIAAAREMVAREFPGRLVEVLASLHLPTAPPEGVSADDVLQHVRLDKKRRRGELLMVLPLGDGGAELVPVATDELRSALIA